jgi:hypothetical protein
LKIDFFVFEIFYLNKHDMIIHKVNKRNVVVAIPAKAVGETGSVQ